MKDNERELGKFYKLQSLETTHRDKPRLVNESFPMMSNLIGLLGESIYNELFEMAHFFLQRRMLLLLVVAGLPGSGKSTFILEYIEQMQRLGFQLRKLVEYETAYGIHHEDWVATNNHMYNEVMEEYRLFEEELANGEEYVPQFMVAEGPMISMYEPEHPDFHKPENRDRAVSFAYKLRVHIDNYPIYFLIITGEGQARKIAVDYREKILELAKQEDKDAEDIINAFLWAQALLNDKVKIKSKKLLALISTMAMPFNLAQILEEFGAHKATARKRMLKKRFKVFLQLREKATGKKITPREAVMLVEALTFNFFVSWGVKIPQRRIINAINPRRKKLEGAFYDHLSKKMNGADNEEQDSVHH